MLLITGVSARQTKQFVWFYFAYNWFISLGTQYVKYFPKLRVWFFLLNPTPGVEISAKLQRIQKQVIHLRCPRHLRPSCWRNVSWKPRPAFQSHVSSASASPSCGSCGDARYGLHWDPNCYHRHRRQYLEDVANCGQFQPRFYRWRRHQIRRQPITKQPDQKSHSSEKERITGNSRTKPPSLSTDQFNLWPMKRNEILTSFWLQQVSSVEARICDSVPKRWNNMATNWMIRINPKKKTNTKPIGSSRSGSFVIKTFHSQRKIFSSSCCVDSQHFSF